MIPHKPYEEITVADICATANVGRATFYAHYRSKDDLKRRGIDEHLRGLLEERRQAAAGVPGGGSVSATLIIFEHALEHLPHYRALVRGRSAELALNAIRQTLTVMLKEELDHTAADKPPLLREMKIQYLVGAFISVLTWWLNRGAPESPAEIEALFRQLGGGLKGKQYDHTVWSKR